MIPDNAGPGDGPGTPIAWARGRLTFVGEYEADSLERIASALDRIGPEPLPNECRGMALRVDLPANRAELMGELADQLEWLAGKLEVGSLL